MTLCLLKIPRFYLAIPAIALVSVNLTNIFGPVFQLGAIFLVLLVSLSRLQILWKPAFMLLPYLLIAVAIGVYRFGADDAVIKASKLVLFGILSVVSLNYSESERKIVSIFALRSFLALAICNFILALLTGQSVFRAGLLIEFSIYSSYTIAFLVYLSRPSLTIADRVVAYGCIFLLGSTTGLAILLLGELLNRKVSLVSIVSSVFLAPAAWIAMTQIFKARDKQLTVEFLLASDRGMLLKTFFEKSVHDFSWLNWLFGIGVGQPMHSFITFDKDFYGYLLRLCGGEMYAFGLHNEPIRLICDYGLIGLVLVTWRTYAHTSIYMFGLLWLSMVTNSYLYSFSGAVIASGLMSSKRIKSNPLPNNALA